MPLTRTACADRVPERDPATSPTIPPSRRVPRPPCGSGPRHTPSVLAGPHRNKKAAPFSGRHLHQNEAYLLQFFEFTIAEDRRPSKLFRLLIRKATTLPPSLLCEVCFFSTTNPCPTGPGLCGV